MKVVAIMLICLVLEVIAGCSALAATNTADNHSGRDAVVDAGKLNMKEKGMTC